MIERQMNLPGEIQQRHAAQREALREEKYEEEVVKFLLNKLNLIKHKPALLREYEASTGRRVLKLSLFNDHFPDFPILLGTDHLPGVRLHVDPRSILPALIKNFANAPFVKAYDEFYEQVHDRAFDRTVGLVFPRKGIMRGLIIFNAGLDHYWHHHAEIVYHGGTRDNPYQLHTKSFAALIESIRKEWRPNR